jgi:hypothetical protein
MPIVGSNGSFYWFVGVHKEELPEELMPLWEDA